MEDDHPHEACGVFAICASPSSSEPVAKLAYFGLYALQHRGQESAGITTFTSDGQSHTHKDMGLVSQVFDEEILGTLQGSIAVGHNRYSTTGSSKICNAQPIVVPTRLGDLALAHNGNLVNANQLRAELIEQGYILESTSDSEGIALAIAHEVNQGHDWISGISKALLRCQGAFSLAMAVPIGIFAARDGYGVRPLVVGQMKDGTQIIASETCGLDIIGAEFLREVAPGELLFMDGKTMHTHRWLKEPLPKLCIFEMIYFARPDSVMQNTSLYNYRITLGKLLAQEAPADADLVIGVPDSGIPAAIGFAQASGIPFGEGLIKNRYVGRTFIQPTQAMREAGIRMKLNPLKDVLSGKRIVVIDDSIVRGTTSRKIVRALRSAGAVAVHMRISSPPVTHPCFYGIDTDSQDQLIAARHDLATITKLIEVDSLAYLSHQGMLQATQVNQANFCTACFDGNYPIAVPDQLQRTKFMLEATTP